MPYVGTNFGARNATWYDPNMRSPYVMNWSGGLQVRVIRQMVKPSAESGLFGETFLWASLAQKA